MGFFDALVSGLGEAMAPDVRRKYREMPLDELKREWNRLFGNRSYSRGNIYMKNTPHAILDEVYAERVSRQNWLKSCMESIRREEEAERVREEEAQRNLEFESALTVNDMVQMIVEKINSLAYEACTIQVTSEAVAVYDSNNNECLRMKYVRYGYPDLSYAQQRIFCTYLLDNLNLNYKMDAYECELVLNDAPGGMKSSW